MTFCAGASLATWPMINPCGVNSLIHSGNISCNALAFVPIHSKNPVNHDFSVSQFL